MSARLARSLGLSALAALLTACGSNTPSGGSFQPTGRYGGEAASAQAPATLAPSTIPTPQIDAQVLARYREYQKEYENAYKTGDASVLPSVAANPLLNDVTRDVEKTRAKGEIWRFTNVLNPRIKGRSKDNSIIVVIDCVKTLGTYRFSATTGKRLGSYPGGSTIQESIMRHVDGTWKISDAKQGQKC